MPGLRQQESDRVRDMGRADGAGTAAGAQGSTASEATKRPARAKGRAQGNNGGKGGERSEPAKGTEAFETVASYRVPLRGLKHMAQNPRIGNVDKIAASLKANGQYKAITVRKATNEVLAGNHTLKAARKIRLKTILIQYVEEVLGVESITDEHAENIMLVDNRSNDEATYDADILAAIFRKRPNPAGTGYDDHEVRAILAAHETYDTDLMTTLVQPPTPIQFKGGDDRDDDERLDDLQGMIEARGGNTQHEVDTSTPEYKQQQTVAEIQLALEPLQDVFFESDNYYGVPTLSRRMLVDTIPDPIGTWGGEDATPDDGVTNYIWNFGVAASKGLPWKRAILSFFTYDTKFAQWWEEPAYQTARVMANGLRTAILPDYSFWNEEPRFMHLQAQYRSQWMGRFFQEAGIKVMPRFMWCDAESIKTGLLGVPDKPPVAAVCFQAASKKEFESGMTSEGLREFVKRVQPDALLVYGGNPAKGIVADAHLPKELHVVHVDNYAHVRRHIVFDKPQGKLAVKKAAKAQKEEADV